MSAARHKRPGASVKPRTKRRRGPSRLDRIEQRIDRLENLDAAEASVARARAVAASDDPVERELLTHLLRGMTAAEADAALDLYRKILLDGVHR